MDGLLYEPITCFPLTALLRLSPPPTLAAATSGPCSVRSLPCSAIITKGWDGMGWDGMGWEGMGMGPHRSKQPLRGFDGALRCSTVRTHRRLHYCQAEVPRMQDATSTHLCMRGGISHPPRAQTCPLWHHFSPSIYVDKFVWHF